MEEGQKLSPQSPYDAATAACVMRLALAAVNPADHAAAAAYLVKQAGATAVAVLDGGQARGPLGFITAGDIARAVAGGNDLNEGRIRALMSKSPGPGPGSARQRIAAWCSPPPLLRMSR
jgi:CBS domain-containing protein